MYNRDSRHGNPDMQNVTISGEAAISVPCKKKLFEDAL